MYVCVVQIFVKGVRAWGVAEERRGEESKEEERIKEKEEKRANRPKRYI